MPITRFAWDCSLKLFPVSRQCRPALILARENRKENIEKRNSSVSAASKLVVLKRRNEVLQIGAS